MMVIWNLKDTALINEREGFDGGRTFISGNKGGGETIWDLDSGDEDECGGDDDIDQQEETVFFSE